VQKRIEGSLEAIKPTEEYKDFTEKNTSEFEVAKAVFEGQTEGLSKSNLGLGYNLGMCPWCSWLKDKTCQILKKLLKRKYNNFPIKIILTLRMCK
jgi:hypothetical protein